MPAQALAAAAALLSFAAQGNRIELRLDRGAAELAWESPSSFRFRRTLEGPLPPLAPANEGAVEVKIQDTPSALLLRSRYIEVSIAKRGLLVTVRRIGGDALMTDLTPPRSEGSGVVWERAMPTGVRYYGLARRADLDFDWRGRSVTAETPLLISTAGYGEYHAGDGPFRFDFTAQDRYAIRAPRVDYYFYYGPKPKAIFEERQDHAPAVATAARGVAPPTWTGLRDSLIRLVHGAMAGLLAQTFDLDDWAKAPPDLLLRARQVASLLPDVRHDSVPLSDFRRQLDAFYTAYDYEVRDKGHPTWHPLPFQFPDDPECALHADEFMLGDEMLIAPILDSSGKRSAYLPQGIWTNLETNQVEPGRRTIAVESKSMPVFARNGTIVPLDSPGGMGLHYFPTLAAEFFILEREVGQWTQVHASPAADIFRLEIESKVARDYQWVVHHVEQPSQVGFNDLSYRRVESQAGLADRTWYYDPARKNLHVRTRVAASEDRVIHVTW